MKISLSFFQSWFLSYPLWDNDVTGVISNENNNVYNVYKSKGRNSCDDIRSETAMIVNALFL